MTDLQLANVGKLALNFNAADELTTYAVGALMECSDFEIAKRLIYSMRFERKLSELEWLLDHHSQKKCVGDGSVRPRLKTALDRIGALAVKRNQIFHAHISGKIPGQMDFRSGKTGTSLDVSSNALRDLVNDFAAALNEISTLMPQFMDDYQVSTDCFCCCLILLVFPAFIDVAKSFQEVAACLAKPTTCAHTRSAPSPG